MSYILLTLNWKSDGYSYAYSNLQAIWQLTVISPSFYWGTSLASTSWEKSLAKAFGPLSLQAATSQYLEEL